MSTTDEAMLQDWQRALDSYESASALLELLQDPDEIRHVTAALEDGRYAVAASAPAGRASRSRPVDHPASSTPPTARPASTSTGRRRAASSARSRSAPPTPTG